MPTAISTGTFATQVDFLVTARPVIVEMIGCRIVNDQQPFGVVLSVLDGAEFGAEKLIFSRVNEQYQDSPWTGEITLHVNEVLRAEFIGVENGTVCIMKVREK